MCALSTIIAIGCNLFWSQKCKILSSFFVLIWAGSTANYCAEKIASKKKSHQKFASTSARTATHQRNSSDTLRQNAIEYHNNEPITKPLDQFFMLISNI